MKHRDTIKKDLLGKFKEYLDEQEIDYRDGKGKWQVLQVMTDKGWQVIYDKKGSGQYYTVGEKLSPFVDEFLAWLRVRGVDKARSGSNNSTKKDRLLELLLLHKALGLNYPGCNCYDEKFWENNSNLDINNPADHEIWCPEYIMYRIEGIISCDF